MSTINSSQRRSTNPVSYLLASSSGKICNRENIPPMPPQTFANRRRALMPVMAAKVSYLTGRLGEAITNVRTFDKEVGKPPPNHLREARSALLDRVWSLETRLARALAIFRSLEAELQVFGSLRMGKDRRAIKAW